MRVISRDMERKRKILHIDMDDTICDYKGRFFEMRKKNELIKCPQSQYGFFTGLDPLPGAIEAVQNLMEFYDVYILTRPSVINPMSYTEKRVWVEKHLGMRLCHKLIICPNKALVIGDYLVDDVLWPGFGGEQILFGAPWAENWGMVEPYLIQKADNE